MRKIHGSAARGVGGSQPKGFDLQAIMDALTKAGMDTSWLQADAQLLNGSGMGAYSNQSKAYSSTARLRRLERGEVVKQRGSVVPTSGTRGRPNLALQDSSGNISIANSDVSKKGSVPPTVSEGFSYTATDTSITWTWTGVIIRRADGTQEVIPDGSLTISGLTASTKYYFLPFWPPYGCCKQIGWVVGTDGSPQFAFSAAPSLSALWQQTLESREPLSSGAITGTTGAPSATNSGGDGGSDGVQRGGTCPRVGQVVRSKTRGIIKCEEMHVGEHIESPAKGGWVKVKSVGLAPAEVFLLITTRDGEELETTLSTPQPLMDGGDVMPRDLTLEHRPLVRPGFSSQLRALEFQFEKDMCVMVEMTALDGHEGDPRQHTFYCGWGEPNIATHNIVVKTT